MSTQTAALAALFGNASAPATPGGLATVNVYGYKLDLTPLLVRVLAGEEITLNKAVQFLLPHLPAIIAAKGAHDSRPPAGPVAVPTPDEDPGVTPDPDITPEPIAPALVPDGLKLGPKWAKVKDTGNWPEGQYSSARLRAIFEEGTANFGWGDSCVVDLSPFMGQTKLHRDDVERAGLAWAPRWEITVGGKTLIVCAGEMLPNGEARFIVEGEDNGVHVGGAAWRATLGYNLRLTPDVDEETVEVRAILGGLVTSIRFRVS